MKRSGAAFRTGLFIKKLALNCTFFFCDKLYHISMITSINLILKFQWIVNLVFIAGIESSDLSDFEG